MRHALGHKVERNKKRYNRNRLKLEELIKKYPNKSVLTLRGWMQEDDPE